MTSLPAVSTLDLFIRLPEVKRITGSSTAGIYRGMDDGTFPRSIVLGPNARAWRLSEIEAWQAVKIAARDTGADAELRVVNKHIGRGRPRKITAEHSA